MTPLLKFELGTYLKKPGTCMLMVLLLLTGFVIGIRLSFSPGAEIYRNASYAIANMTGLLSLTGIFITTFLAAQILFKEQDADFSLILYATPITRMQYLVSRFMSVLCISSLFFIILMTGYLAGQLADPDKIAYGKFNGWFYIRPILILAFPNLLLCTAIVSSVAWLGRNKLLVYLSGLFIYIIYLVMLMYSGSPMMAGSLPQSPEAIMLSAKIDPFGLSAFYQQTNLWTVAQKNASYLDFTGNLLFNRLIYLLLTGVLLLIVLLRFKLNTDDRSTVSKKVIEENEAALSLVYKPVSTVTTGILYHISVLGSFVRSDMKAVVKNISFLLLIPGLVFYLSMEFYGSIDQGIRLPERYVTTSLIANRIIYNLPGILLLVVLFYGHELYWRSSSAGSDLIENSTPHARAVWLWAKWVSLAVVIVLFTSLIIVTGITFQIIYQYPEIDWQIYAVLYWLVSFPVIISAGLIISIQSLINNKWIGLLVTCIVLFLLATSIGRSLGITHPLLRFPAAYTARHSEMNGWDDYSRTFSWRMLYGTGITLLFLWLAINCKGKKQWLRHLPGLGLILLLCLFPGIYILNQTSSDKAGDSDNQQAYEQQYRKYSHLAQPVITDVRTQIDLYPENNAYNVTGRYTLENRSSGPIKQILVNFDDDVQVEQAYYCQANKKTFFNIKTGFIHLPQPLMPGDTASFSFSFAYRWTGFTGHEPFNAIVHNGTFIRISNYFPKLGYQSHREIASPAERRKRGLGSSTPLLKLEAPAGVHHFIHLDMSVSTTAGQTVIGTGNLVKQWKTPGRNHYRYQSGMPIPFRFGVSSAAYQVKKAYHQGINIEIYYDSKHPENVPHLIKNTLRAMDYCQSNFGPYPFKTIRFAEVSSFTDGFAGTAYPATIFMTEQLLFHDNLTGDKGQDVINELAAHELSHQWWGNGLLAPDEREGSKMLTETLAMYTELMLTRHCQGMQAVREKVAVHRSIYMNERGFTKENPLYKVSPDDTHLYYSKGLVVMYRLTELLGEDKINKALRSLLEKSAFPHPPPVSTDLLHELYQVSTPAQQKQIEDLFVQVKPL